MTRAVSRSRYAVKERKRLYTKPHFESEGFWNSEVAYSLVLHCASLLHIISRVISARGHMETRRLLFSCRF